MKRLLALIVLLAWGGAATAAPDPGKLQLASVHAVVADLDADAPLVAKNADRPVPIASLTKLMTALVAVESGEPLGEWLTVVKRDRKAPNNAYSRIRISSQLQRGELLRLALMSSENLAAHVVASHHPGGRKAFIAAMNATAEALGMTHSRFVDPSGLSPRNRASALDVLKLVRAAYAHPEIRGYSTTRYRSARFRRPRYRLGYGNTNPLVSSSRWDVQLTKTGYLTEAGRCLAMVVELEHKPMAVVLLDSFGSRSPVGDAGRIRRWLATGNGGSVAPLAAKYERERSAAYQQARAEEDGGVQ